MTQAAQDIGLSGHLDGRLPPVGTRDEVARLVDTFNRMMDRLENAFTAQRRFVADASHELRTPLAAIAGNAELARAEGRSPAELRELFGEVELAAARMRATVEGMLTLARADAGAVPEHREPVDLAAIAAEAVTLRRALAAARGVAIACADGGPGVVRGDPGQLRQLVGNLLDNAIRYNRPGGAATVRVRDVEVGRVELAVEDSGIGIAAKDLPRVFERFFRADAARARDDGEPDGHGTGLGLAIAKWIAEAHGGGIAVASAVGAGSTFTVTLPAAT
jgi:signal transduction histidine kinase